MQCPEFTIFPPAPPCCRKACCEQAADEMLDYQGSGQSVMEMSHRSKTYDGNH